MTREEIREIAIDSSKAYYEYLVQEQMGIQEINVLELEYLHGKDTIIRLRLSSKLFDTESIFFKNLRNNRTYDRNSIKVIEYDNDKNILLIKPTKSVKAEFESINQTDIKVISDLKFLVERIKIWYEINGISLALPTKVSKYSKDFQNIEFFKDKNFQPSENQKKALENIFTNPFSYIWGAPGTGKTQFVLSYAILHYIRNGDKIAILAPTNNAIEQVLRGVIAMTDKAGVDRKQIIRLGTPSKKFAEAFPEVCEEKGVQKKIAEMDKQIDILERMLNYKNQKKAIDKINNAMSEFDNLTELLSKLTSEQSIASEINVQHKKKEIEVKLLNENLLNQTQQLNKTVAKKNSFFHKIVKFLSRKPTNLENEIIGLEEKILICKQDFEYSKYELSEISSKRNAIGNNIKEYQNKVHSKIQYLINQTNGISEINTIVSSLSADNINKVKESVSLIITQKNEKLEVDQHLFIEYERKSLQDIQFELNHYLTLRHKLASSSTEERLKSMNVIACTLDSYIGRYAETSLNVEHIFLDEAGYASIIKALTLFNHRTPISFLGDHKQLPPVCEINERQIETDNRFHNMFLWAQSAIFMDTLFSNSSISCRNQYLQNSVFSPIEIKQTSLHSTYRFGNNLARILANHVYSLEFHSNNPEGETQIISIHATKNEPLKSRVSSNEVLEIKKYIADLRKNGIDDFVILTPYKKQITLLNNHLPQERNELKILTVHGSQGREWHTVILSVVDTKDKFFVDSKNPKGLNLINTAVSRAKRKLVIVCDKNFWAEQEGQLITELVNSEANS